MTPMINVHQLIQSPQALTYDQGHLLNQYLTKELDQYESVILDFSKIDTLTPTFVEAAFSSLTKKYEPTFLQQYLKIQPGTLTHHQFEMLTQLINNPV